MKMARVCQVAGTLVTEPSISKLFLAMKRCKSYFSSIPTPSIPEGSRNPRRPNNVKSNMLTIPIVILIIIAATLIGAGLSILLSPKQVRTSSDLSRIFLVGFLGAALLRLFLNPTWHTWKAWERKLMAVFMLITGIICLYAVWLTVHNRPL